MKAISMMTQGNSLTIVGDLGQGIYYYKGIKSWSDVVDNIFDGKSIYKVLKQSYRSTVEIIEFANKVLQKQKNYEISAKPILRHGDKPEIIKFNNNKEFCEMVDKNQKQMRQLKEQGEMEIKLERTRLSLLQSRVNPHFMFNILNIIAGLAVEEEAYRTRKFTIKTASYFRYSLDSLDKIVKLENEIKNVQLYLEIQKERFGEKVEWEISMQDECGKLEVPAMILQPLCENSIVHGMSAILKRVHILVSARVENEYLFLSVSDDGEGISEETINNINQKMRQHKKMWRRRDWNKKYI